MGSGCGAVGRAVAFKTRGPRFDSSHRQNFIEHLFIINCIEKTKINKKEAGNGPLFKKIILEIDIYLVILTYCEPFNRDALSLDHGCGLTGGQFVRSGSNPAVI